MKNLAFFASVLMLCVFVACSTKQDKKTTDNDSSNESEDPIEVICQLAEDASSQHSSWEEEDWIDCAKQLSVALDELPSPLEMEEEYKLNSSLSSLDYVCAMHKRKAASMIKVLKEYKKEDETKMEDDNLDESTDSDDKEDNYDNDGDCYEAASDGRNVSSSYSAVPSNCQLEGLIDNKYKVTMHLVRSGDNLISGNYYYNKNGSKNKLQLNGTVRGSRVVLSEYNADMQETGHFEGVFSGGMYTGSFNTPGGRLMPFRLQASTSVAGVPSIPRNKVSADSYNDANETGSTNISVGGENWDEMIDAYERYVNKMIPYIHKIADGDMTVMNDYLSLSAETHNFAEKLMKAKGMMTTAQWSRYFAIHNRLLQETVKISEKIRIQNKRF